MTRLHPVPSDPKKQRVEHVLAMSLRIGDAIALDIEALEKGKFSELKTTDPEIDRLCAVYAREVKALKADGGLKGVSADMMNQLRDSGARLNGLLARHQRLVTCMRNASEGLVQAVAEEVLKIRDSSAPYGGAPKPQRSPSSAILYNNLV
jgi:hypothetical protein